MCWYSVQYSNGTIRRWPPLHMETLTLCLVGERVGADPSSRLFGWKMGGLGWLQEGIFRPDVGWLRPPKSGGRSEPSWVPSLAHTSVRRLHFAPLFSMRLGARSRPGWMSRPGREELVPGWEEPPGRCSPTSAPASCACRGRGARSPARRSCDPRPRPAAAAAGAPLARALRQRRPRPSPAAAGGLLARAQSRAGGRGSGAGGEKAGMRRQGAGSGRSGASEIGSRVLGIPRPSAAREEAGGEGLAGGGGPGAAGGGVRRGELRGSPPAPPG